jgi:hypothetical protein
MKSNLPAELQQPSSTGQNQKVIKPFQKQREAARIVNDNLITLYGGAIRGGKTYWLILLLWTYALKYPKSRWLILRNSYTTLLKTTLVTFQKILDDGLNIDVSSWNSADNTVTLHNGSQIVFMAESYDNDKELNRFRGLEINGAGVDELNEIQKVTFNKLIERSGSWQHSPGCPIKIVATCNPTHNWVKEDFYDRWKLGTLPKGWAYVPAKITDNPHISKEYIDSLKNLPKYEYDSFVLGDWEVVPRTGGEFYKLFNYDDNTVQDSVIDPALVLHISFDFNVNPYMTITVWQFKGKIGIQIDELCLRSPQNSTPAACKAFLNKYGNHAAGVWYYGDPSGKARDTRDEKGANDFTIIGALLNAKLRAYERTLNAAPPVAMRGNFINQIFSAGFEGIELKVDRRCKNTISDYVYLKEASDGTKLKEKVKDPATLVTYEKYGHTSDANDYLLCHMFQNEFRNFQRGGIDSKITVGKNLHKNSY